MINIFKKGYRTLTSDVDTWVVRWNRRYGDYHSEYSEVAQFFTDECEAKEFAKELKRANKLLGHTAGHLTKVVCEKVKNNGVD